MEELRDLEPDIIMVAAYGKLLPKALLEKAVGQITVSIEEVTA